jgi:hypothetical protein
MLRYECRLYHRLCRFGWIPNRRIDDFCCGVGYTAQTGKSTLALAREDKAAKELYQEFIEEASKSYVDALIHDEAALAPLVSLYALINKMRVVSHPRIAERADGSFAWSSTLMSCQTRHC